MRYYINQLLINVAMWCLDHVQFRCFTNEQFKRERLVLVKRLRQCV